MSLRCPLCLEPLRAGTMLHRFCPRHPSNVTAFTVSDSAYSEIYCPEEGCEPTASILAENVFLLHEGCRCLNPYWDGKVVDLQRAMSFRRATAAVTVHHWELSILREVARCYPARCEMWFPQILFRAVNEQWRGRPFGAPTLLVGARPCGKTVLSLMAMSRDAFSRITSDHFVHVTQSAPGVSIESLLRIMDALDVLRRGVPPPDFVASREILPSDTEDLSNLKSIYFWSPSKRKVGSDEMGLKGLLSHVLDAFVPKGWASAQYAEEPPTHVVLALYDTAGEMWAKGDLRLLSLRA